MRLISKILSICLYDQSINWGKKKIKLSFVYTPNSPIHRGKKWNKYWRVTSKKKRKFMSWNQNLSTETEGWRLISLLPKAIYRFIIIRPFRPGCHCSEQPYSTLRSNITFARSAEIPHDHISNSLDLVSLEYALIQSSYCLFVVSFFKPFFSLFLLHPY